MKKVIVENVEVIDIADKGKSVAKPDGKTMFIEGAVPGDIVDVELTKRSKAFDEARMIKLLQPSPDRVEPFCSHFGLCGGCRWQHLDYSAQLRFKEKQVNDAMVRIGHIDEPAPLPIIGADSDRYYRNKLEFTFTGLRYFLNEEMHSPDTKEPKGLGFHIPGKFNKVLDIHQCYLQDNRSNDIRQFVRSYTLNNNYPYFHLRSQEGLMRNLIIRNTTLDEWMVIVVFKEDIPQLRDELMKAILERFPWITSLQYFINPKRNDSLHDQQPVVWAGKSYILEQLEDLKFKIGAKSFFQTNTSQALALYRITRDFAGLTGSENVYDLYTGTGSIAAFLSAKAKKITGIEYVKEAVDDALENAGLNGLTNLSFIAGDMKDILTREFFEETGLPDVIITDPPRAGMHPSVVQRITESGAPRVVYVSCNPATQARDIAMMADAYRVEKMQPVDMFPHTSHVENVALLSKF